MWSITDLRQHPHFAPFFAHVHPLCWLILWWQLNILLRWFNDAKPEDVLYSVNTWGFVTIRFISDPIDPDQYKPLKRTFRPLTDASWESTLPACLGNEATHTFIFLRKTGEVSPKVTEAARPLHAFPNTL